MSPSRSRSFSARAGIALSLMQPAFCQVWNWTYGPGYLAAGNDIFNGQFSLSGAEAWCGQNDQCQGFTFQVGSTGPAPTQPVDVFFKDARNYVCCDNTWATYTKTAKPMPPDVNFTAGSLAVSLRAGSHTVEILSFLNNTMPPYNFSFVPPLQNPPRADRSLPGCHQLGDITIRTQPLSETNGSSWALFSSAWAGNLHAAVPIRPFPYSSVQAMDDITNLLNATPTEQRIVPEYPLSVRVTRLYEVYYDPLSKQQSLIIRYNVTALQDTRIGGLGFSIMADDTTDQNLNQIAFTNSFVDPHIGSDHAWAEWTRVIGNTTMLVVPAPVRDHPGPDMIANPTRMEAWRPLLEDCNFNGQMSEWTVLSGAWASEWVQQKQAPVLQMPADLANTGVWPDPKSPWPAWHSNETVAVPGVEDRVWTQPTFLELKAGQTAAFGLRFVLAEAGPRSRDAALQSIGEPVLTAVPGYTISTEMTSAILIVSAPAAASLANVSVNNATVLAVGTPVQLPSGEWKVAVTGLARGRARVSIQYTDGTESVAHYHVLPPFSQQVAAFGNHLSTVAWLPREYPDPFGRSASVMPWDREDGLWVLDDSRAYIVGLSDDAGAAQNLAHAMKVAWAPVQAEVTAKDDYIKWTLFGTKPDTAEKPLRSLQLTDGTWQVRMTTYYYCATPGNCTNSGEGWNYGYPEQDKCDMPVGGPIWCMTENMADATYRGYNYPHQAATWLAMYRVARNYDQLSTYQAWDWYLWGAFNTALQVQTADVGFMDGTVFREILDALQTEGASNATIAGWASQLDKNMKYRADQWSTLTFPYGSEFNFDTTGQEEVYIWLQRYGYYAAANRTLDAVLAYMRLIPNWAWHGGARSIGDLGNNGKWFINRGTERMLMHYRAGLNNIPVLEGYRYNPDDWYLLQVGMGALTGQLTNIDESGATSMGYHSAPFVETHDPHSGDYGCGFFGITLEASSYLVNHPSYGWLCYLCNLGADSGTPGIVSYSVVDAYQVRSYLEPLGVYLVAEAGNLQSIYLNLNNNTAIITFAPAVSSPASFSQHDAQPFTYLRLSVTQTTTKRPPLSNIAVTDAAGQPCSQVRDAYQIQPSGSGPTTVYLNWSGS